MSVFDDYIIDFKITFDFDDPNNRKYSHWIKPVNHNSNKSWSKDQIVFGELKKINGNKYILYGHILKRIINGITPGIPRKRNAKDLQVDLELDRGFFMFYPWFDKSKLDFKNSMVLLKNLCVKEGLPEPPDLTYFWNDWIKEQDSNIMELENFPEISDISVWEWIKKRKQIYAGILKKQKLNNDIRDDLQKLFIKEFGDDTLYIQLTEKLFNKGLLDDTCKIWTGTGMYGKESLSSLIKLIGLKFFHSTFSESEIKGIAKRNFSIDVSSGTVKKSKPEKGEFLID
ncbi:MAG: hypothetical protein WD555_03735 [Fulvivirga sp.]